MSSFFIDTNILVYAFGEHDAAKRARARRLADTEGATVSTQVLSELANVMTRRLDFAPEAVRSRIESIASSCEVVTVTPAIILNALRVMEKYRYGFFDSQIIASALAAGVAILYSEDLHDGQTIDSALTIQSPFHTRTEQSRTAYRVRRARRSAARRR